MKLSTAILAGGKSQRTGGRNKAFLMCDGRSLIERLLCQLSIFDETLISVGTSTDYNHLPFELVWDEIPEIGPLGGIHACLKRCRNEHLFVCATDMPGITADLVQYMAEFVSSDFDCFVLRSHLSIQPMCTIYTKRLVPLIDSLFQEKRYSPLAVFDLSRVKYIPLSFSCFDESVVANINYVSELDQLQIAKRSCKPAVFAVSGLKNSGKTTLITKLVSVLKGEGYRVGVIKHDGHDFEADAPNTDTNRFRQAGGDSTLVYSSTKLAFVKMLEREDVCPLHLAKYMDDCDIVIIEGLKHSNVPKIEVVAEFPICDEAHLLAIATDGAFKHRCIPTYSRSDIPQLLAIIKGKLGLPI
ncbi:MAG: molybdopterin-guanine dinucleotide biosynthesis protein B [Defluviitaleaceae bacterium]|nr:molybdopterin-guanine dinucleotide biosynthesis protein B [Defluviitaleaceae bacterium]